MNLNSHLWNLLNIIGRIAVICIPAYRIDDPLEILEAQKQRAGKTIVPYPFEALFDNARRWVEKHARPLVTDHWRRGEALDLYPDHAPARKGLGAVHLAMGGFSEAEKIFRGVVRDDPGGIEALLGAEKGAIHR